MVQRVKNLTSVHEDVSSIPGLAQWIKVSGVAASCGLGHRYGFHLALQWLWCTLAAAALIRPLAWEPPYAAGTALKSQKKSSFVSFFFKIPHMSDIIYVFDFVHSV